MELPDGWINTNLGSATQPLQKRVNPKDYPDLPYIGMENIEAHTMRLLGTVPGREMRSSADTFRAGDVLYGRLRPYLNKVYCPDFDGLCSTEFIVFRKSPHLISKYLQYFLNSWEFVSFANSLNTGDRPRVKFEQLADYPFPLPPYHEQERIVARIENLLSQLEAGVAALKRAQAGLRRYRASVLKAAISGKLLRVGFHNGSSEVLEAWQWVTLPEIGFLGRGKSKHRPRNAEFLYGGQYPFIQTGDIREADGIIKSFNQTYNDAGLAQSKLWPKGTLCITIAANIADTAILGIDACFPDSVVGVSVNCFL
jgi:restriction endonuclease S subunit